MSKPVQRAVLQVQKLVLTMGADLVTHRFVMETDVDNYFTVFLREPGAADDLRYCYLHT